VDGTFRGMPAWTNSEILFYRKDLFEDPVEQAAFEQEYGYPLAVPTTWDEFTDAAVFFTRDTNGDGSVDLYGTDVKGAVETEWLAHVLQAGSPGAVLDSDGNVIIDNAEHLAALEFYSSLATELDVSPPGAAQLDLRWTSARSIVNDILEGLEEDGNA
jgi:multiple sugar transport system substrate-binding protein